MAYAAPLDVEAAAEAEALPLPAVAKPVCGPLPPFVVEVIEEDWPLLAVVFAEAWVDEGWL